MVCNRDHYGVQQWRLRLEILKEQEIDVMFTDIRMPKMDGIELVQKMQSLNIFQLPWQSVVMMILPMRWKC